MLYKGSYNHTKHLINVLIIIIKYNVCQLQCILKFRKEFTKYHLLSSFVNWIIWLVLAISLYSSVLQLYYIHRYGHFSGINRKVQLKYQPTGRPKRSSSEEGMYSNSIYFLFNNVKCITAHLQVYFTILK